MIVEVTEAFRVEGTVDEETGWRKPDCTIPVGFTGVFIREGVAVGLPGVEDGDKIYVMWHEESSGDVNIVYVPKTKARLLQDCLKGLLG